MHWKNWAWIQTIAEQNAGNQLHGRRLHVWRWERPLYKYFSKESHTWEQAALDKVAWLASLDDMVAWRHGKYAFVVHAHSPSSEAVTRVGYQGIFMSSAHSAFHAEVTALSLAVDFATTVKKQFLQGKHDRKRHFVSTVIMR